MNIFNQLVVLNQDPVEQRALSLFNLASLYKINPKTIVEVGVWKGANAELLRLFFPDAHLFLVDPWKPYSPKGTPPEGARQKETFENAYRDTQNRFKNDPKVTIIQESSLEASSSLPSDLDIVFIDGDHRYSAVKSDIRA